MAPYGFGKVMLPVAPCPLAPSKSRFFIISSLSNLPSTRIYVFKKSMHIKIKEISQQLPFVPPYVSTTWPFQRSYLHEQDALRQQLGVKALQRKMRMDLDQQARVLSY